MKSAMMKNVMEACDEEVAIAVDGVVLDGDLVVPAKAEGIVIFAHGSGSDQLLTVPHFHARASFAAIGIGLNDQTGDLCLCPKFKVGACIASGSEKCLRGIPAPAAFLIHFKIAHTFIVALIEVT